MDDVLIVSDTPFRNKFTLFCAGLGALWVGSIIYNRQKNNTPARQHNQNKRYMIKQQTKLNRDITHLNRNIRSPPMLYTNYYGRHRRFNGAK